MTRCFQRQGAGPLLLALAGALAGFLLVARVARAPFIFDDTPSVVENRSLREPRDLLAIAFPAPECTVAGRPLANATFAANHAWGGLNPAGYRIVNAVIHAANVLLLFAFGSVFLRLGLANQPPAPLGWFAASAAAIWAVHPLILGTVVYVSQRTELLLGLFFLLTLLGALRSWEADASRRPWRSLSVAACFSGVLCKEPMVTAPAVVMLLDWAVLGDAWRARWRSRIPFYAALLASWIPLALLLSGLGKRAVGFGVGATVPEYVLTQCRALGVYFGKFLFPINLTFDYGPVFLRWSSREVLWIAVPLLIVAALILVGRRSRALGCLLAAGLVILAPTSSIVPVAAQPIAENRAYLPGAFLALAGVVLVAQLRPLARLARYFPVLIAALGLTLAAVSSGRLALFSEPESLWRDTIAKVPDNPRAYCNLGEIQLAAGRLDEAEASFRHALALKPDYTGFAATNLGVTLVRAGRAAEALEYFRLETELLPDKPSTHDNLGNLLTQLGRDTEAAAAFERALRLDGAFVPALNNLAGVHFRAGRLAEAIPLYQRAAALDPSDDRLRRNLAVSLLLARRPAEVLRVLQIEIARPDLHPDSALIGASALLEQARARDAATLIDACLVARPVWPEAKLLLGNANFALGKIPQAVAAFESALVDRPGWDQARAALERARSGSAP